MKLKLGLGIFYAIRPEIGSGLFCNSRSPHGPLL